MNLLRHWKTLVGLCVVFVAGVLVGGVATVRHIQREYRERLDSTTWMPRTLAWLTEAAALSPTQVDEIRPIVEQAVEQMKELRDASEKQRKSVMEELLRAVAMSLPKDQQTLLIQAARAAQTKTSAWGDPTSSASPPPPSVKKQSTEQ